MFPLSFPLLLSFPPSLSRIQSLFIVLNSKSISPFCAEKIDIVVPIGIEFLGPIFVKFGQWMSTRRDIFPRDICDTLSQLQQNAMSHSWQHTKHLLESTYGPSWRDLFVRFDEKELLGSGCCAQVHTYTRMESLHKI